MDDGIDYEQLREKNIQKNRELLKTLGLDDYKIPEAAPKVPKTKKKNNKRAQTKKRKAPSSPPPEATGSDGENTRVDTSLAPKKVKADMNAEDEEDGLPSRRRSSRNVRRVSYAQDGDLIHQRASPWDPSPNVLQRKRSGKLTVEIDEDEDEDEDHTKLRNVPKMGKRTYSPYVNIFLRVE